MKRKKIIAIILVLVMVVALCACTGSSKVRDDVSIDTLSSEILLSLGKDDESFKAMDKDYMHGYMMLDVDNYDGFVVYKNALGANIDELGIFKAKDSAQAKEIKTAVEKYLDRMRDGWMDEYMPLEKPKLTSAKVKLVGNYVMYSILSEEDVITANQTLENALKG